MNFEALSDAELRTKILEYGFPVGPVTQTTRKTLVKKLKNLEESRSNANSRHSLAARYSSDDTDDDNSTNTKKKKKAVNTRRQTLANPMPPPTSAPLMSNIVKSSSRKRISKNSSVESDVELSNVKSRSIKTPTKDKSLVKNNKSLNDNDGLETGSDSDAVEEIPQPLIVSKFGGDTSKIYNDQKSTDINSSKTYDTNWRRTIQNSLDANLRTSSKSDRYSLGFDKYSKPSTILDSVRSDINISRDSSKKDDILSNYETPFLSAFTRNLSVQKSKNSPLPGTKHRFSVLSSTPEVKENESNGHLNSPLRSKYPSGLSSTYVMSSLDKTRDTNRYKSSAVSREEIKNNHNFISMVLVGVVALFFIILAIVYLGLEGKTDDFPLLPNGINEVPLCSQGNTDKNYPGINCIPKKSIDEVYNLINRIYSLLTKRSISYICDGTKELPYISNSELEKIFSNPEMPGSNELIAENLKMAYFLIFKNPKWGISLIQFPDNDEEKELKTFDDMEKVLAQSVAERLGIVIKDPTLPWQCFLKKRVQYIVSSLLIVAFGVLGMIGCQKLGLAYWNYKKNAEQEVFKLVSQIINMLELHHQNYGTTSPGGTQESYLAINHIRDNLIPPKDRKKMSNIWDKAVKFLDENESRIRREVQLVSGEEFQVWRWLPFNSSNSGSPGSSSAPKMSKVWQGSAFETQEGSVNSLACSPTPCLKIRHMFDPDTEFEDNWETKVKDAILEKCGEKVKILHIKVDRGSREGCVYMKCMSQEEAGKAYKALHGSWFDGHLVTVKYLRLERYHERFPEAKSFLTPLKPSNNQRLSMQGHYWTNSSEAN